MISAPVRVEIDSSASHVYIIVNHSRRSCRWCHTLATLLWELRQLEERRRADHLRLHLLHPRLLFLEQLRLVAVFRAPVADLRVDQVVRLDEGRLDLDAAKAAVGRPPEHLPCDVLHHAQQVALLDNSAPLVAG